MGTQDRIVIVGGGLAAARVARAFRDAGGKGSVSILSADTDPPYNRPPLSKGFLRGEIDGRRRCSSSPRRPTPSSRSTCGSAARSRPSTRRAHGRARGRRLAAPTTGSCSRPARCRARSARPARRSTACTPTARCATPRPCARRPSRPPAALVIGGGFIGMETTASLRRRGLAVTQVDLADQLYASLQAPPLSHSLERLYREHGVEVILGDVVAEFRGSGGRLTGAVTERRARDRGRARDRRRRRAALDRLPRRLGRRARDAARCSSTSASPPTSPASGPSATSRTSTIPSSATGG